MEITIKSANNGYVLSYYDEEIKETRHIAVEDVGKDSDCLTEARLTRKLLWEIMECFGIYTSKHAEEQLRILVVDKNEKEIEL